MPCNINECLCEGFNLNEEITNPKEIVGFDVNEDNTITVTFDDGSVLTSSGAIDIPATDRPAYSLKSQFNTLGNNASVEIPNDAWGITESNLPATMQIRFAGKFDPDSGDLIFGFDGDQIFAIPTDLVIGDCIISGEIEIVRATNSGSEASLANFQGTFHISQVGTNAEAATIVRRGVVAKDLTLGPYDFTIDQDSPTVGETTAMYSFTANVIRGKID